MSCQDCKRDGANQPSCPFRMADGRNFTSYNTRCSQFEQIRNSQNFASAYDLRMYMTQNANQIMTKNRMHSANENNCVPCYSTDQDGTMLPEESKVSCNGKVCATTAWAPTGLGQGRNNYGHSSSTQFYPIEGVSNSGFDAYGSIV